MQNINLLFRLPEAYKPWKQSLSLSTNGFFFGEAHWEGFQLYLRKGANTFYQLNFLPHKKGFYYLDDAFVVDNGLYALYANADDITELEEEFHKEVLAACLRELFPCPSAANFEDMPLEHLVQQLPFYTQPLYFPFKQVQNIRRRIDYFDSPELMLAMVGIDYRQLGAPNIRSTLFDLYTNFPDHPEVRMFKFFMEKIIGDDLALKPEVVPGMFDSVGEPGNPYRSRMEFLMEYFFRKDKENRSYILELSDRFEVDPHDPLTPLDFLLSLLKADLLLNERKDYAAVAKMLKHLSFFGGNELILYYQLLGCMLARQGFLYEAERYKLKAVGMKSKYPLVYHQLGRIAKLQGRIDDAIAYFEQSITLDKHLFDLLKKKKEHKRNESTELELILCKFEISEFSAEWAWQMFRNDFRRSRLPFDKEKIKKRLENLYSKQRKESIQPLVKDMCKAMEGEAVTETENK